MLKEKGYDEFLNQKIEKGLNDFKQGRYLTAEQAKQQIEKMLRAKEIELQEQMSSLVYG
ncbi:hypothetical protein M3704_05060 [Mannheimia haemolytica]|nr:hypothetical protein M3704_05060 [Mannheimia haemolytica]STY63147.1 Uncharacterised protein [Mannheimia haemolytica]HDV7283890.1 hypothetical protein [Mannheimia haemolytica]